MMGVLEVDRHQLHSLACNLRNMRTRTAPHGTDGAVIRQGMQFAEPVKRHRSGIEPDAFDGVFDELRRQNGQACSTQDTSSRLWQPHSAWLFLQPQRHP